MDKNFTFITMKNFRKPFLKLLILLIISIIIVISLKGCASMGTNPDRDNVSMFKHSMHYDANKNMFVNRNQDAIDEMWDKNITFTIMIDMFKGRKILKPTTKLPELKPDLSVFLQQDSDLRVIWFGHSSFMLNIDGIIVLVDPVFTNSSFPVNIMNKRFQPPVLKLNELPVIDYILISHDHYDHLDMKSVKYFIDKKARFVVPLGVGSHLKSWGIPHDRIVERDWWVTAKFDSIQFIATPAQHFSGRGLFDRNKTLWASWVIKSKNHSVYFSGDSGYDIHFKAVGKKYGPFDIAFLECGQYNNQWREVHMFPEDSVTAFKDLRAKKFFPIHWGMFILSKHPWNDPPKQLYALSKTHKIDLIIPKIGQLVNVNHTFQLEEWWNGDK